MEEKTLAKYWWLILLRGIIAIIFALLAFFWTELTLEILIILFGIYILLDGIFCIFASIKAATEHRRWWLFLLGGIAGVIVAVLVFSWPGVTALILLYLIAIWAIVTGMFELLASIAAPWEGAVKVLVGIVGIVSLILGIILLVFPAVSLIVMIWLLGIYALIAGISLISYSIKIRR